MESRVRIIVTGFVQGVGYRYYCYRKAVELGITGYAKNLPDGNVELEAEGEKGLINEFIKLLKTGPMNSNVKSVNVEELLYEKSYTEFKIY